MVQKEPARRGRPRSYDPQVALAQALDAFWEAGYAATSLDDLSRATGMNRPSLYAAFGDKDAIYRKALEHYWADARSQIAIALDQERPLREALQDFYDRAIEIYRSGNGRGCFMVGTALTEAMRNPKLRAELHRSLHGLTRVLASRIALAQSRGEIDAKADAAELAIVAVAILDFLAIQARVGTERKALKATATAALNTICGPPRLHKRRVAKG
jgi:AcrR family transcriptional regulator